MRARRIALAAIALSVGITLAATVAGRGQVAPGTGGGRVAIVTLDGVIDDADVAPGRRDNLLEQLRRAGRDPAVGAIVLRINSPGGSATASQALHDEVRRLRAGGTPVVAYFADVATSGGLYVGVAADRVVAQPATITGSIGVILTSFDLSGLYERVGVEERVVQSGEFKDLLGSDLTAEERRILERLVGDGLDQFVRVVATGRGLPEDEVRRIADGRVFSGTEAQRLRLVDELGGEERAIRLAAELAGIRGEPRTVVFAPAEPGGLFSLLGALLPGGRDPARLVPGGGLRYEWR